MKKKIIEKIDYKLFWDDQIGEYITNRKDRDWWQAYSPLREDKRASFSVSINPKHHGGWIDFGTNRKGDVFKFLRVFKGWNFHKSYKFLSDNYLVGGIDE